MRRKLIDFRALQAMMGVFLQVICSILLIAFTHIYHVAYSLVTQRACWEICMKRALENARFDLETGHRPRDTDA